MKLTLPLKQFSLYTVVLLSFVLGSCSKDSGLHNYEGFVTNPNNEPVVNATIQIFHTPEDWLTGHNVVVTMRSNLAGRFESEKIFEAGEYYIFIEKYDSSNWEIRNVEQGIYPTVNIPEDGGMNYTIDYNNMALLASTSWKLSNVHREYSKPGHTAIEWQSVWTSVNNCRRDNTIYFGKDMSMRVSEGYSVCSGMARNILGAFVPPIIFSTSSCVSLPNTSQDVKEFEYSGWPEMEAKGAKMYLDCSQTIGQLYVYYASDNGVMQLDVYSRN